MFAIPAAQMKTKFVADFFYVQPIPTKQMFKVWDVTQVLT